MQHTQSVSALSRVELLSRTPRGGRRSLETSIREDWTALVSRAVHSGGLRERLRESALAALPAGPLKLMSTSSKISKGEAHGVLTGVIYLAPAGEAVSDWRRVCPHSTAGCRAACLVSSGHMGMSPARNARLWRTVLYLADPARFWALAVHELHALAARAARADMLPAFRVNGTSDIETPHGFAESARMLGVRLYGYTKDVSRALANLDSEVYSFNGSDDSRDAALDVLSAGGRVSVVLDVPRGADIPSTWNGYPAVDGDATDAIFTQPAGSVLVLRLKGTRKAKSAARRSAFAAAPRESAEVQS